MMRWVAGLAAVLLLPACGDGGSNGPPATVADGGDPAASPAVTGSGQLPSVRIVSPDSGSSASDGSSLTIHAVADDPNAALVRVDFYDDNRLIGSDSSAPYALVYRRLDAGTHVLCAVGIDKEGAPYASTPVTLFVVRGDLDDDKKKRDK